MIAPLEQKKLTQQCAIPSHSDDGTDSWTTIQQEIQELKQNAKQLMFYDDVVGLRGLTNLGNTCFMNCILQSFIHNPLLQAYFLNDGHNSDECVLSKQKQICLACELDSLFSHMFSGAKTPYSPHHFMYSIWKCSNHLAGYDQQDAHEFFISSLNNIHLHCNGTQKDCKCIIHKIFCGTLRSDVTCKQCGVTSTTFDPFFDISLDISKPLRKGMTDGEELASLADCLNKYTQPENLGVDQRVNCENCKTYRESVKQLSMQFLPTVLCFHLKRFKQKNGSSQKVNTFVEFPLSLDMTPYSSIALSENQYRNGHKMSPEQSRDFYELFTVVNHFGTLSTGHYTCYIRHLDAWYQCDDNFICKASLHQVLNSNAYLLFYVRNREKGTVVKSEIVNLE
jgi:ubiquitin carboxyl-terminal hydrolase 22/27/51